MRTSINLSASICTPSIPTNIIELAMEDHDMMKIMIATDNHIGYLEKDPIRCNDSLEAFEEILKVAKGQNVDFILLGGDLFHENKPSRQVLHKTMELLRHYCMGNRPCPIEMRSDPAINFQHSKFPVVNYEDPNYNVAIPIFIIHGNHDDPTGEANLSALDVLSVSNMINYFGKATNIEQIEVSPLLLQKGNTKLALYGLGSCRDERLHRMFRKGKVKFLRPTEEEGDWFNILVLHQNRAKHGATNYIPETFIPSFFDLVFWGHEHECLIEPEFVPTGDVGEDGQDNGIFITQPGSSVATSLSDGEQKPKQVGILYIKNDCTFKIDPIPLSSVRAFVIDGVQLKHTGISPQEEEEVKCYLQEKVESMINRANAENEKLPLIRLKVDYNGGYSSFSTTRFGQTFLGKVANPQNILLWHRHHEPTGGVKKTENENGILPSYELSERIDISELLEAELKRENLGLLSEKNLVEALSEFVVKEENDALTDCVKFSLQKSQDFLRERPITDADIEKQIEQHKEQLHRLQETEAMEAARENRSYRRDSQPDGDIRTGEGSGSDSDNPGRSTDAASKSKSTRGRGRGSRGRGRGSRGRGSRGKTTATPAAGTMSPLTFHSSSSTATRKTSSRKTTKRTVEYVDSESDEDMFTSKSKKKQKSSAPPPVPVDIDLTMSDEDDFSGPTANTTAGASFFTASGPSKRRKK